MSKKTILIVDGNNRSWAAFHAYSKLRYKGESVSMIYGFPSMMRYLITKFQADDIIIVWDGEKSSIRLNVYPEYKGDRKHKTLVDYESWKSQKYVVQGLMDKLGVKQSWHLHSEADDVITKLIGKANRLKFNDIIIVSSDKDFNQLLGLPNLTIFNESKKVLYTKDNLHKYVGYRYYQTVDYLTLVGDNSDNIKGYPKIGEKRALELLEKYDTLADFLATGDKHRLIDRNSLLELIERNRILIDLQYFHKKYYPYIKFRLINKKPKVRVNDFLRTCAKYNMQKLMNKNFIKPFKAINHG